MKPNFLIERIRHWLRGPDTFLGRSALALGLVVVALGFLIFLTVQGIDRFRLYRWNQLAEERIGQQRYAEASQYLKLSLKEYPRNRKAVRLAVRLAEAADAPNLLAWRQAYYTLEPADTANALALAKASLAGGLVDNAAGILSRLDAGAVGDAELENLRALLAVQQGRIPEAAEQFGELYRKYPDRVAIINNYVMSLVAEDFEKNEPVIRHLLREVEQNPGLSGHAARLNLYLLLGQNKWEEARELADRLSRTAEKATDDDRITRILLHLLTRSAEAESLLREYAARAGGEAEPLKAAVVQLMRARQYGAALFLLRESGESWRERESLLGLYAQLMLAYGRHRELAQILQDPFFAARERSDSIRMVQAAYLSRALEVAGREGRLHRTRALSLGRRIGMKGLHDLLRITESWPEWDDDRAGLGWELAGQSIRPEPYLLFLYDHYLRREDTRGVEKVMKAREEAGLPLGWAYENNLVYLKLLRDPAFAPDADAQLSDLIRRNPGVHTLALTRAFCLWRLNRIPDALALWNELPDSITRDPAHAWLGALLLDGAGRRGEALELAAGVDPARLLPTEASLFRGAFPTPQPLPDAADQDQRE